ncbi:MAG TPA: sugar transferase [Thermoanaerobaculia bacterium]
MTTYHFDYEHRHRPHFRPLRLDGGPRGAAKVRGVIISGSYGTGAYYYDLRTRHPIAARVKRLFDLLSATAAIIIFSPLLLTIMSLIKLTSPGPLIFRQRRIGFRGNQFDMYKFRTMYDGAHLKEKELARQTGTSFLKIKNDPRITPLGRFLRKYSLDELPQLFNVLEGSMSMVGPRPLLGSDLEKLPRRAPLRRFAMLPGITGLWQVSGRSDCSEIKRMQFDRQYVDQWSLGLDLQILFRTVEVVITGRGSS